MKIRVVSALVVTCVVASACEMGGSALTPREGVIEVPGGRDVPSARVWYRVVGSGEATPLLLLHGGPGAGSTYLKPLAALADERPVIFYDQLGGGRSDTPNDTTLWTTERYVRELAAVREELGLDRVHILGHSWGTILAVEYLLTKPDGVESLVLASPVLSARRWLRDADSLKTLLPDTMQKVIAYREATLQTDSADYQEATMEYYRRFMARKQPWSVDVDSSFKLLGKRVYEYMWGPSEFAATGTLKTYDVTPRLAEIELPVLFTAGRHDEATPRTTAFYASLMRGAKITIFEESGHLTMHDEPEKYVSAIREFLREVEAAQKK
jgi:proline-specific peptidase